MIQIIKTATNTDSLIAANAFSAQFLWGRRGCLELPSLVIISATIFLRPMRTRRSLTRGGSGRAQRAGSPPRRWKARKVDRIRPVSRPNLVRMAPHQTHFLVPATSPSARGRRSPLGLDSVMKAAGPPSRPVLPAAKVPCPPRAIATPADEPQGVVSLRAGTFLIAASSTAAALKKKEHPGDGHMGRGEPNCEAPPPARDLRCHLRGPDERGCGSNHTRTQASQAPPK